METKLGKITKAKLGTGGYQDAMFGFTIVISIPLGEGLGTSDYCDFKGNWTSRSERADYSVEQWHDAHGETYAWLRQIMADAKVDDFTKLVGIPISAQLESTVLKEWRVLTEVL